MLTTDVATDARASDDSFADDATVADSGAGDPSPDAVTSLPDSGVATDAGTAADTNETGDDCQSSDEARYACCVFDKVNEFRSRSGLSPYQWNIGLSRTAFYYADFMAVNRVFAHSADGMNVGDRLDSYDVAWTSAGENLQRNDLRDWSLACEETVNGRGGWANSRAGHREAMLGQDASGTDKNWTHAAAGVARSGDQWYVAMYFVRF